MIRYFMSQETPRSLTPKHRGIPSWLGKHLHHPTGESIDLANLKTGIHRKQASSTSELHQGGGSRSPRALKRLKNRVPSRNDHDVTYISGEEMSSSDHSGFHYVERADQLGEGAPASGEGGFQLTIAHQVADV